jgi:hypothetical protein
MMKLKKNKELWLTVFLQGKVLMLQQKSLPSTLKRGSDYFDLSCVEEKSLLHLLPNSPGYPEKIKRDV